MKSFDPMPVAISAIENASTIPVSPEQVLIALRTGEGHPSHLRALFGDVAFEVLISIGIRYGVSNDEIGRAYAVAARSSAAKNTELDEWCEENLEAELRP